MSESDTTSLSAQVNRLTLTDSPIPPGSSSSTEPSELVAVVDDLLNQLSSKFNTVSSEILAKMDEMSKRLDALESTIQTSNASPSDTGDSASVAGSEGK